MPRRHLERRMTIGYSLGLLLVGLLSSISTYVMYQVIDAESTASRIYDTISVQQNLIQKIALLTIDYTEQESPQELARLSEQLDAATANLVSGHRMLTEDLFKNKKFEWQVIQEAAKAEEDILTYKHLDREIRTYVASSKYLADRHGIRRNRDDSAVQAILDKANSHITTMLGDLHSKYRASHNTKQARYKTILGFSLGVIIIVLVLEGVFLFRPLVRIVRKEHDEIVAARDKADKANRVISQFLANVSHEIRTPLTAIIGFSDMILMQPNLDRDLRSKNRTIRQSAIHLKTLIDDLLDFSKASESHIEIQEQDFDFTNLLHEVVSILTVRTTEKQLTLAVTYETPVPETITSDPTRIKQVFFNIIGNAIKFTERGRIDVLISYQPSNQTFNAVIKDTGHGIKPADQERIFSRFVQVDSSMTRKESGSGIGLSLSKMLCQALGGDLILLATSAEGSSFGVTFKARGTSDSMISDFNGLHRERTAEITAENIAGILPGVKILLVEDGKENREIYTYFLSLAGAEVVVASNGKKGVEIALAQAFDLILMDIQMPEMDGYDAAQLLIANAIKAPIFALTAHALQSERRKCLAIGFAHYLSKPIAIEDLITAVAKATGNGHLAQSKLENPQPPPITASHTTPIVPPTIIRSQYHDEPIYQPMIQEFSKNLPKRVATLQLALQQRDWHNLSALAHKVKGAGASYGYQSLSRCAHEIETQGRKLLATPDPEIATKIATKATELLQDLNNICAGIVAGAQGDPNTP